MGVQVKKILLKNDFFQVQSFFFKPEKPRKGFLAIGTHGYTASKNSVLEWGIRLSQMEIPTLLFDLPGHYLGSFSELSSFEDFKNHGHELFYEGVRASEVKPEKLFFMGHSLGALLALKANAYLPETLSSASLCNICVGLGVHQQGEPHLLESSLFNPTLKIRSQLVSPYLKPTDVFSWLREEKNELRLKGKKIFLINGQNDAVVGAKGSERLIKLLEKSNNSIVFENPKNLPHHKPEMARAHIAHLIKKYFFEKALDF